MHHVAEKLPRRVPYLEVKAISTLNIDTEDTLVPLEERQRSIRLQIEIQRTDDLLLKVDELLPGHLLAEQCRQPFYHHVEAGVHMLEHLCCQEDANCR